MKMRPGEVKTSILLDSKKLQNLLNYELRWTLDEGLGKTIPYYEKIFRKS